MKEGPDIALIASLMGDPARSNMLTALMDGRALTASELAAEAGVTKQTASSHLAKLFGAELIAKEVQGRHHYYRLDGPDVAHALEVLMGIAENRSGKRTRTGPKDPALRKARICYDHLAGELGVHMFDRMTEKGWLDHSSGIAATPLGLDAFVDFGIDVDALMAKRRPLCRTCLDWSMRRSHLSGSLGQALLQQFEKNKWLRRIPETRIISFTPPGERAFLSWLK
ncbi:MAG: ArsR/SmtB family transcription factor [Kordiimonas sp.]